MGADTQVLGYPQPRGMFQPKCCQNKTATNRGSLASLWLREHIRVTEPCPFRAAALLRERGPGPSRIRFCPPAPNRAVTTARADLGGGSISEPNPATPLRRWAGAQEDQWRHPLTPSRSCAADGDTSAPSEDGFPQQQSFLPRQAAPMSDGLWMRQETPAQAGRAVALLYYSAAMTVTKSGAELFASSTKSIVVPGRNYNCSILPLDFIFIIET